MSNDNEYMKDYMLRRYHNRMLEARVKLGGECVDCSSTEELEFDHIDPSTKSFTVGRGWSRSAKVFWAEVDKCQLLCRECHEIKTLDDNCQVSAKTTHGTLSSYRYCKCNLCRKAMADYNRSRNNPTPRSFSR